MYTQNALELRLRTTKSQLRPTDIILSNFLPQNDVLSLVLSLLIHFTILNILNLRMILMPIKTCLNQLCCWNTGSKKPMA